MKSLVLFEGKNWADAGRVNRRIGGLCLFAGFLMLFMHLFPFLRQMADNGTFSLGDIYAYLNLGTDYDIAMGGTGYYRIPLPWMLQWIGIHMLIGDQPVKSWEGYGLQVLVRSGSKREWLMGELLFAFLLNVLFSCVQIICAVLFCVCLGGHLTFVPGSFQGLVPDNLLQDSAGMVFLRACFLPFWIRSTIGVAQVVLMIRFHPLLVTMALIAYDFVATCIPAGWVLGNYTMILRQNQMFPAGMNGQIAAVVIFACAAVMVIFVGLGCRLVKRKGILSRRENELW